MENNSKSMRSDCFSVFIRAKKYFWKSLFEWMNLKCRFLWNDTVHVCETRFAAINKREEVSTAGGTDQTTTVFPNKRSTSHSLFTAWSSWNLTWQKQRQPFFVKQRLKATLCGSHKFCHALCGQVLRFYVPHQNLHLRKFHYVIFLFDFLENARTWLQLEGRFFSSFVVSSVLETVFFCPCKLR